MLSNSLNVSAIKLAKSMYKGLNAIYYDRKYPNNQLEYKEYSDRSEILNCKIALENCSQETQEFYIRIQVPEFIKDSVVQRELTAKSEDLKGDKKFVLHSKEKQIINAVFLADLVKEGDKHNGSSTGFEIQLVNDKESIKFTKAID